MTWQAFFVIASGQLEADKPAQWTGNDVRS